MLERIFAGRGELAGRMRAFDWSATDLGPPEHWPETLRVALGVCLSSPIPMQVCWGPRLTLLYNDALIPLLGPDRHPGVLGRPALQVWPQIWISLAPVIERVRASGVPHRSRDIAIYPDRNRPYDAVYVTFSFSPLFGANGRVEGIFGSCTETTTKKVSALAPVAVDRAVREAEGKSGQALVEAARQSEQRYRDLFNSISEAYVLKEAISDEEGNIIDFRFLEVNPAFETQAGVSDVVGKTMREVTPDIDQAWLDRLAKVVRTGVSTRFQQRAAAFDRWFEVVAWRIEPENERVAMLFRDVTKRKRAERTTAELNQRFTSLVDNTPLAVVEWDADFVITRWSGHAEVMFGWTASEVVGRRLDVTPLVYEEDKSKVETTMLRLLDPANTFVVSQNRNNTKNGDVLYCEWYNSVLHDETGRMVAILSLVLDVSERERTEAALRESEARLAGQKEAFQLAVNGAPLEASLNVLVRTAIAQAGEHARAAFLLVDADGTCLRAVSGAGNMPDSYIQRIDGCAIDPNSPACGSAAYFGRAVITKDVVEDPLWAPFLPLALEHDFRACWSFPIQALSGRVLGTFAMYHRDPRDVTPRDIDLAGIVTHAAAIIISRHQEAEERKAAENALRDADRRKDEFLATLAHELRNPLAPIRNAVDVMRLAGDNTAITLRARQTIERQLTQLIRLVDDLLDVSRITRDKIDLRKERVTLSSIVQSAVETSRPLIDVCGHALTVTLPSEVVWLDADMTRMAQVVANLLNNAAKYTPEHGHLSLTAERQDGEVVIRVRDSGVGIPQEMLPHVFDMFTQVDSSRNRSQGGLGLGLTIVKRLVEMHGGSVHATSEHGQGSEFIVRVPVVPNEQIRTPREVRDSSKRLPSHRVLVVDDNRDAASTLGLLLEMMGNTVRIAHDGRTALEVAGTFQPTLALLDIGMPGMDGYEVARHLRSEPGLGEIVLVAVTGWGQEEDRRRSLEAGFDDHLTKPPAIRSLQKLLSSLSTQGTV